MVIVFTLCSANYLAHAKTLGDSVLEHNPDVHFVIGLVDRFPKEVDSSYCDRFEVIPVEQIGCAQFAGMRQKYNIVELNTAVKPFYIAFLYERNPDVKTVIYLDPDILVCGSLDVLLGKLKKFNIILTPHSCTFDNSSVNIHYEKVMLYAGVFNLGFIATSRSPETQKFLQWWQIRLQDHCFFSPGVAGSFFDQLWVGLVPLYFRGVYVETDPGYNMSYWNHFERRLNLSNKKYVVNGSHDLIFFHFSAYRPDRSDISACRPTEPIASFAERPDLRGIYDDYRSRLLTRNYQLVKSIPWYFAPPAEKHTVSNGKSLIKGFITKVIFLLPHFLRARLKRLAQFVVKNTGEQKPA